MARQSALLQSTVLLVAFALLATSVSAAAYRRQPAKRAFDALVGSGFSGFDKRSAPFVLDSYGPVRFAPYEKRAFDTLGSAGFLGFDKRAFDSFGTSFDGFDRRRK